MEILKMILSPASKKSRNILLGISSRKHHGFLNGRCFNICAFFFIFCMLFCSAAYGQSSEDAELEYRVKAAFLLNFTKFVTWPDNPSVNADKSIIVCVLGNNPFGKALDSIQGKEVSGRPIKIIYETDPKSLPYCHVIFISANLGDSASEILRKLSAQHVLTVGESKSFSKSGGMIDFINIDNKIRFEINPSAVEAASLKMSSQLLKLAIIVETNNKGN
jgi:hypothetical protein